MTRMRNLVMIGMPACGKTSVGVLLARALGMGFIDTDRELEHADGRKLSAIARAEGPGGFRALEEKTLLSLSPEGKVIATGGSAVYSGKGMEHLRAIEYKTGRRIDGIINNCHLLRETDAACVARGHELCLRLCEATGRFLWCDTYPEGIVPAEAVEGRYEHLLPLGLYMRPNWIDK